MVAIPHEYFVPGSTIHCWLVWSGEDYTVTKQHIIIPIARRAEPTDEEPTPDEVSVVDQAISKLNEAVTQTGQNVEAAAVHAEQAEQSAQAAVAAQNAAEAAKDQAVQSAASVSGVMDTLESTIHADLQAAKESGMFDGKDGKDGYTPQKGVDYFDGIDGAPGQDGVSPSITVMDITGGHQVTITDTTGSHSFDVLDGDDADAPVRDVQVNGASVLNDGVANVDAVMVPGTGVGSAKTRDFEHNGTVYSNEASGRGSFAEGGLNIVSGNFAHVEGVQNTVTGGSAHAEGQQNSALGARSHSEGYSNIAKAIASHAEGVGTLAAENGSHAEGYRTSALGIYSHVEGDYTVAFNQLAHAEGGSTSAYGIGSHAEGIGYDYAITISGDANVKEYSYVEDVEILDNDRVVYKNDSVCISATITSVDIINKKITLSKSLVDQLDNKQIRVYRGGAIGQCSHIEGYHTTAFADNQHVQGKYNIVDNQKIYASIVGNGTADDARSNAFALTWEGDGHYAGDVYVHANADSAGGTKLATVEDIPEVPVQDVQVNGTSILENGVANVPVASENEYGVVKVNNAGGLSGIRLENGTLKTIPVTSAAVKAGNGNWVQIVPSHQHESTFYGLTKAAGVDMASSANPVGTYTDEAKIAIQKMLGIYEAPWELIADETLTEDATSFIINVDSNGLPFQLIDMFAWVEYGISTSGAVDYVTCKGNIKRKDEKNITITFPTGKNIGTSKYVNYFKLDKFGDTILTVGQPGRAAGGTFNSSDFRFAQVWEDFDYLYNFSLSQYNNTTSLIPSGTRIKLYGRRKWQ